MPTRHGIGKKVAILATLANSPVFSHFSLSLMFGVCDLGACSVLFPPCYSRAHFGKDSRSSSPISRSCPHAHDACELSNIRCTVTWLLTVPRGGSGLTAAPAPIAFADSTLPRIAPLAAYCLQTRVATRDARTVIRAQTISQPPSHPTPTLTRRAQSLR